jgi:hypothetical protein
MTPKEKASDLFENFIKVDGNDFSIIQCALLTVKEIIKSTSYKKQRFTNDNYSEDYWQEVKQEIKKL